ncbi:MAG TPA: hypothetical protein VJN32_03915 [Dehalococcoidia bacterium]|nr:hypothetical protein [Dehalococcoidia bacterium]
MGKRVNLLIVAAALVAGAFGASALAVEWRGDSTDMRPLVDEIARLRAEVEELRDPVRTPPPEVASPTPTPEPTVVAAESGTSVEFAGVRLTVGEVYQQGLGGNISFTLENLDSAPLSSGQFNADATDEQGFACRTHVDSSPVIEAGEKARFWVSWNCEGVPIRTLFLANVRFDFPQP